MTAIIERIQRLRKEEKGITLIELLAVIVIIGVIAAIAVPLITGLLEDTKENARSATANQLVEAAKLRSIATQNGNITGTHTLANLVADKYMQSGLTDPKTGKPLVEATTKVNFVNLNSGNLVTLVIDGETINFTADQLKNAQAGTSTTTP
ncbi:prepilin-type N-terminal cleavage/methylation domain-containing protein [Paenibacillus macerans]|uniref:prepilin-type N-terminal cleavage/methylation domain-containing protein n=1 Tax=Paenibacillus macerans TaxID=44252 RepID=UPI003D3183B4